MRNLQRFINEKIGMVFLLKKRDFLFYRTEILMNSG